jgi:ubiquinone/menaquinone biosynthesis C-methylase UbiE
MTIDQSYDTWAAKYDSMLNKTRDLEKKAAQETLNRYDYKNIVELGCGTGKNTSWLLEKAEKVLAIDFSPEMQKIARQKINSPKVSFLHADLTKEWNIHAWADLITCSLVLEHIRDLHFVFKQASETLLAGGYFYICELHPFRQYSGSKANYEKEGVKVELEVFIHHLSDYTDAAMSNGFKIKEIREWFDEPEKKELPRLISFVFEKK